MNAPHQIYNVDESGVPLDPKALNVVAKKGSKKVRVRSTGRKGQVTVVACGNAAGQVIPPMIIFDAKKLCHAWTRGEVPGTSYGLSDKGWITTELFQSWLTEHFLKHAVAARPLILLLDGHSTHYQYELIQSACERDVIILCLPPHTTHDAQPLDCSVFSPLKSHWRSICHQFIQQNPGRVITKYNFNGLFSKAWLNAVTPANLIAGFRKCGVYPFNASAIAVNDGNLANSLTSHQSVEMPTSCHSVELPASQQSVELPTSHQSNSLSTVIVGFDNPAMSSSTTNVDDGLPLAAYFEDVSMLEPICEFC